MITDFFGMKQQQQFSKMGLKIQQAGIEANIYQTRLQSEDESLQAMIDLRKNLGTQIAVFAARGTSMIGGSSVSLFQESIGNFESDERMRRMNLLGRENELRAGGTLAQLNQSANNSKLWQGFASRTINRFPSNLEGWNSLVKQTKQGFGLTQMA